MTIKYKRYTKKQFITAKKLSKKMTIREIAIKLNINYDTVRGWIKNRHKPYVYYSKEKTEHVCLRLPKSLLKQINDEMKRRGGYTSRQELIREIIRRGLRKWL